MINNTLTSTNVQSNFGVAADIAKSKGSVTITQNGRPTLMLFSIERGEELLRIQSANKLDRYFTQRAELESSQPILSLADINTLVHEYRS